MSKTGIAIRDSRSVFTQRTTSNIFGGIPSDSEGNDGEIQVRLTEGQPRIYAKSGKNWYTSPAHLSNADELKLSVRDADVLSISNTGTKFIHGNVEVLTIKNSGKVGINNTSPTAMLDITNTGSLSTSLLHLSDMNGTGAHTHIQFSNDGTSSLTTVGQINTTGTDLVLEAAGDLVLHSTAGNVGIGTASPLGNLHIEGTDDTLTTIIVEVDGTHATNDYPAMRLLRSKNAGLVADNDILGAVQFMGYIGPNGAYYTNYEIGASIVGRVNGSPANVADDCGTDLEFWTQPDSGTSLAQIMTITSGGNVGIGTNTPESNFHVAADDTTPFVILSRNRPEDKNPIDSNDVIGAIQFRGYDDQHAGGVGAQISAKASGNWDNASDTDDAPCELHFFTEDDSTTNQITTGPRMVIDKAGNVGIGEASPGTLLHVKVSDTGIAPHTSAQITLERDGTNYLQFLTGNDQTSGIIFGDEDDVDIAKLYYDHANEKMQFFTQGANNTTSVLAMTIDTNQNVGIGVADPDGKLEVYNTATTSDGDGSATETLSGQDSILLYGHGGTNGETHGSITWLGGNTRRRAMITAVAENDDTDHVGLAFYTQGTDGSGDFFESMRIARSGKVGIGTIAPAYQLDVYDTPSSNYAMRIFSNGGANTDYGLLIQAGEDDPDDGTPGGSGMAAGDIRWLGLAAGDGILQSKLQFLDSGVYSALVSGSDERMKDNITDTDVSGLEIMNKIKWRKFDWNPEKSNELGYGARKGHVDMWVIAQEVEEFMPSVVSEDPETGCKEIGDSWMLKYACKAIQELSAKVTALEAQIN